MDSKSSLAENSVPYTGPYRATKLWNEIISTFRNGMPVARHSRFMKTYDNCFSSSQAIDWLHNYLKSDKNFGTDVTRNQTTLLLQKLHKARIIEDVRGNKHRSDISDNGRLFRFVHASPNKTVHSRTPLTNRHDLINKDQGPIHLDLDHEKPAQMSPIKVLQDCHLVAKHLNTADIEDAWKNIVLDRLQDILDIDDMSNILDSDFVPGKNIMHNCLYLNKNGIVTNIEQKDQLPHWALSAMRCLAHWPEREDDNLPSYPGFERDVFLVVKDYFCSLSEPLTTYEMYEVILNVFVTAEGLIQDDCDNEEEIVVENKTSPSARSTNSFESVENLLLNLTSVGNSPNAGSTPEVGIPRLNEVGIPRVNSASALELSPIFPVEDGLKRKRQKSVSSSSLPVAAKYETAFGPENKTVTKVYYRGGVQTEYGFTNGPEDSAQTSIETHFKTSQELPAFIPASENCQNGCVGNFTRGNSMREKKSENGLNSMDQKRRKSCHSNLQNIPPEAGNVQTSAKTTHYTKNKQHSHNKRSCSDSSSRPTPIYVDPPPYRDLFPEGYKPVISGASHRSLNRSVSSQALHLLNLACEDEDGHPSHPSYTQTLGRIPIRGSLESNLNSHTLGRRLSHGAIYSHSDTTRHKVSSSAKLNKFESHESLNGRSLSLSDLMHGEQRNRLRRSCSDAGQVKDIIDRIKQSLQLVFLLLPPPNRRKLHILLKLMHKIANNVDLQLDNDVNTRTVLLETFYRSIISCQDEADMEDLLAMRIVSFLIDHGIDIMMVPKDLKSAVDEKLLHMSKTQVTKEDYETQRLSASQKALEDLLEEIINDKTMSALKRKQRLKKFEKTYPDIYAKKFGSIEYEKKAEKPKIKQPLLMKPLMMKIRGLRI